MKQTKQKKCKENALGCQGYYLPRSSFQKTCHNPACAVQKALRDRKIKEQKELRRAEKHRKEKAKTRSEWLAEAQAEFNRFIRLRDRDKPCVSCGRHHIGQYHAGHFLTRKARPDLRFNEDNVHKQCYPCNTMLSGNTTNYRITLVEMLGEDRVKEMESGPRGRSDWTIEEIKGIKATYKEKMKRLG